MELVKMEVEHVVSRFDLRLRILSGHLEMAWVCLSLRTIEQIKAQLSIPTHIGGVSPTIYGNCHQAQ